MKKRGFWTPMLFSLGGLGYVGMELLWRSRSHYSMFLAGGSCFLLLGKLDKLTLPQPVKLLTGAGVVTAVELAAGLLFNREHRVWDYRRLPMNFRGQICALYSLLWIPVSGGAMALHRAVERKMLRGGDHSG